MVGAIPFATAARQLDRQMKAIGSRMRDLVKESHVAACNRVAASVRAEATRTVRQRYPGFKASDVRATMEVIRATYTKQTATVRVRGRRIPLLSFSARQVRAGVSVRIRERKTVRGAFIATMPSGHKGVFKRSGRFGLRGNPKREKIMELKTLSTPQAVGQQEILEHLKSYAENRYKIEFQRELKFRVGRAAH